MEQHKTFPLKVNALHPWMIHHPLILFILLAYVISWISWLLHSLVDNGTVNGFGVIAATGPAIAAVVVSSVQKSEASGASRSKRLQSFCLGLFGVMMILFLRRVWITTGLVTIPGRPVTDLIYPSPVAFITDFLSASAVAFIISAYYASHRGVRELLQTFNPQRWSAGWYWLAIALGSYPAVVLIGNTLASLSGMAIPVSAATGAWYWVVIDAMLMFFYALFCGGGFEEPGWRGFLLPSLQKKFGPLIASLIIGPIWAFWHWPLFWMGGYGGGPLGVLPYSLGGMQMAVFLTALYNRSNGSLPAVILWHATFNITGMYIPVTPLASLLWLLLCIALAIWMWRRPLAFTPYPQM